MDKPGTVYVCTAVYASFYTELLFVTLLFTTDILKYTVKFIIEKSLMFPIIMNCIAQAE